MPQIFRRTPESEEAIRYGYANLLRDAIGKVVRDTSEGLKRPFSASNEELLEMVLAGVGGGTKIALKIPKFANMDETVRFVRGLLKTPSMGREYIPLMKQEVKWSAERALKASKKPYSPEQFKEVMDEATRRQWYREAYEVLSGKMPPWGEL